METVTTSSGFHRFLATFPADGAGAFLRLFGCVFSRQHKHVPLGLVVACFEAMVLCTGRFLPVTRNILNSTRPAKLAAIKRPYTIKEATCDWLKLLPTQWAVRLVRNQTPADHTSGVNHHLPECMAGCIGTLALDIQPRVAYSPAWRFIGEVDSLESAAVADIHKGNGRHGAMVTTSDAEDQV